MFHCAYVYTYIFIVSVYMYMYIFFPVNCGLPLSPYYSLLHIFSHLYIQRKVSSPQTTTNNHNIIYKYSSFYPCVTLYRKPNRILWTFVLIKCQTTSIYTTVTTTNNNGQHFLQNYSPMDRYIKGVPGVDKYNYIIDAIFIFLYILINLNNSWN